MVIQDFKPSKEWLAKIEQFKKENGTFKPSVPAVSLSKQTGDKLLDNCFDISNLSREDLTFLLNGLSEMARNEARVHNILSNEEAAFLRSLRREPRDPSSLKFWDDEESNESGAL
ncbi:TPA: hypothetical protein QDB06_000849 [Burkholderia vietnamiensis]|nr:hypothetical protein [Burkholderia vietnamiensis]